VGVVVDSTLFVDLARRRPEAIRKAEELDARRELTFIPTPVAYELVYGILRSRSRTQAALFQRWASQFQIAALDLVSAERAAVVKVELSRLGKIKGVVDVLTAGIALAGNHTLVSRDRDFLEIANAVGLSLDPY
jgi:predicted nucleic acid-binding protein